MKFFLVEINEGGADGVPMTVKQVQEHLDTQPKYWRKAAIRFAYRVASNNWHPGDAMAYPCGWIFCVTTVRGL